MGFFRLGLGVLTFVAVSTGHLWAEVPQESVTPKLDSELSVAQKIYTILDVLESDQPDRLALATDLLMVTSDIAYRRPSTKALIDEAIRDLRGLSGFSIPGPAEYERASATLKRALVSCRTPIAPGESTLIKRLASAFFFPDHPESASLVFEVRPGKTRYSDEYLASLLMAYLVDPRAAKHDPEVNALMSGLGADGGPSDYQVIWVLNGNRFEFAPDDGASSLQIDLRSGPMGVGELIPPQDSPLRWRIEIIDQAIFITPEVVGARFFPMAEMLRKAFKAGGQGRVLERMAQLMGKTTDIIRSKEWLVPELQRAANAAADRITKAEGFIRKNLVGGALGHKGPDSVLSQLKRLGDQKSKSIERNLKITVEKLRTTGGLDKVALDGEIARAAAASAKELEVAQREIASRISAVERAVAELSSSQEFTKLSEAKKAEAMLKSAEKAGKTRIFTVERGLKWVSAAMTAYYVYHVVTQLQRTQDLQERAVIEDIYFWKTLSTNAYLVPVAGEVSFLLDFMDTVLSKKLASTGVRIDTESVLRQTWGIVEDLAIGGNLPGRDAQDLIQLTAKMQVPPLAWIKPGWVKFDGDGRWGDTALLRFAALGKRGQEDCDRFRGYLRDLMRKQLAVIFYMRERAAIWGQRPSLELVRYESDLYKKLVGDGPRSYFGWVEELLGGA